MRTTSVWTTPATVSNGFSDTALVVRYPDQTIVPVAVPAGSTAAGYAGIIEDVMGDGYTVIDVSRN
jgi:hypothetical protein